MTHEERAHLPTWHKKHEESRDLGARAADRVANFMGSWKFITLQTLFIIIWMSLNLLGIVLQWDPFPFILLNLVFSTQAAYAAPIIMMSQNRAAERDRHQALEDYETNRASKVEIEKLQKDLSRIENEKLDTILALLKEKS